MNSPATLQRAFDSALSIPRNVQFRTEEGFLFEIERMTSRRQVVLLAKFADGLKFTLEISEADAANLGAALRRQAEAIRAETALLECRGAA